MRRKASLALSVFSLLLASCGKDHIVMKYETVICVERPKIECPALDEDDPENWVEVHGSRLRYKKGYGKCYERDQLWESNLKDCIEKFGDKDK